MNLKLLLRISFLIFSISFINKTQAQKEFKAGVQLGISGTQVTGDALSGFNKAGIFAGIFVNRPVTKLGEVQMGINFIQKGSRKNAKPSAGVFDSYLLRLNYIELPVFYRFNIRNNIRIETGLQFAYLINSKEFDEQGVIYRDPSVKEFKKLDFSAFAGINYLINSKYSVSLRYGYSILAIRPKPDYVKYRYSGGEYNEVLCTSVQYYF